MSQTKYANSYTEVYEILNCLNLEDYSKIPKNLLDVFEKNRNLYYKYEINAEQDLTHQPMLKETKAILLTIFRDYLATPEQSKKIKDWLQADRAFLEKQKQEKYDCDVFKNKSIKKQNIQLPIEIKKQSIFEKIINKLKKLLNLRGKLNGKRK